MSKRTDIHCPSQIVPEDYEFVAFGHQKIENFGDCAFILEERERFLAHMKATGAKFSNHEHGGNCDICGAHCVYDAIFHHAATNVYIRIGLDCTEKMFNMEVEGFRIACRNALKNQAGKRKAEAILEVEGLTAAWNIYKVGGPSKEEGIICDMVARLVKYGDLSERTINYLKVLVDRVARRPEIEAQRAAEREAAAPLPETADRIKIEGQVLSVKTEDSHFGFVTKILVKTEAGWKVYGNAPRSANGVERGQNVVFFARIKPSRDDNKFGFFSHPSKFEVIGSDEAKVA